MNDSVASATQNQSKHCFSLYFSHIGVQIWILIFYSIKMKDMESQSKQEINTRVYFRLPLLQQMDLPDNWFVS